MNRRKAREILFQLIYELEFHKDENPDEVYKNAAEFREFEDDNYILKIYKGLPDKLEYIDKRIEESSVGWKQERLSKTSLAIMRLCVYEMLYVDDIPFEISINEAVELAKKFDHENAPAFINGVVNKIADLEGVKT